MSANPKQIKDDVDALAGLHEAAQRKLVRAMGLLQVAIADQDHAPELRRIARLLRASASIADAIPIHIRNIRQEPADARQ